MKKVLVCALAVLFLMASCTTVFAAGIQTTTTYANGLDDDDMVVTTVVTDVAEDTMISFLAENGEGEYVYADQQTSDGDETVFEYKGPKESISSVKVLSGSNAQDDAELYELLLSEEGYVRKIEVVVDGYENADTTLYLPTYKAETTYTFELAIEADLEFDSATLNASYTTINMNQSENLFTFFDSEDFKDGDIFNMTFKTVDDISITDVTTGSFATVEGDTLTVFAKVTAPTNDYGIIVYQVDDEDGRLEEDELADLENTLVYGGDCKTYAALGKGADGSFAIQLVNKTGELELTEGRWVARVYVADSNGEYVYSDVVNVEKH